MYLIAGVGVEVGVGVGVEMGLDYHIFPHSGKLKITSKEPICKYGAN